MSSMTYVEEPVLGAVLVGERRIDVERSLPPLGDHDVLVQVTQCGVCASDIDFWLGGADRDMPAPLGHEAAGVVLEAGKDVQGLAPGSRVPCWAEEGGFSEALVIPARLCLAVHDACRN